MIKPKSSFVEQTLAGITLVLILGALSMIWPAIIALFLGVLLFLQSCNAEREILALSWTEFGNLSIVTDSLRRPSLLAIPLLTFSSGIWWIIHVSVYRST